MIEIGDNLAFTIMIVSVCIVACIYNITHKGD
jgi:hypothetical protein